jgi:hypothetical protein
VGGSGAVLAQRELPVLCCRNRALLRCSDSCLISVHRGLVLELPAARCSSSRAGAVDVSLGSGSGSSISVNLPPCRPGRGRRNWFSGTELRAVSYLLPHYIYCLILCNLLVLNTWV